MNCKDCKHKTLMDYNTENQCYVCPDCGYEDYALESKISNPYNPNPSSKSL